MQIDLEKRAKNILAARRRLDKLHDYYDITPALSLRIDRIYRKALELDPEGGMLDKAVNVIYKKLEQEHVY